MRKLPQVKESVLFPNQNGWLPPIAQCDFACFLRQPKVQITLKHYQFCSERLYHSHLPRYSVGNPRTPGEITLESRKRNTSRLGSMSNSPLIEREIGSGWTWPGWRYPLNISLVLSCHGQQFLCCYLTIELHCTIDFDLTGFGAKYDKHRRLPYLDSCFPNNTDSRVSSGYHRNYNISKGWIDQQRTQLHAA